PVHGTRYRTWRSAAGRCRFRPAIRLILPFRPASGHKTLKLVGPIQREHATPAQPTLFRGGKIFTIQPFSRKCPIGHALDIPFENWTSSSLRIYISAVDDMGAS